MNNSLFANPQLFQAYQQDPGNMYAQALMQQGMSTAPVRSPAEGLARALSAGLGGLQMRNVRNRYEDQGEKYRKGLATALQGGDVLGALSASDDPQLQEMALQAQLQRAINPEKDPLVEIYDPTTRAKKLVPQSQAAGLQSSAPELAKAPETRTVGGGNGMLLDQEFDPNTGQWKTVGSRSQFAPQQPKDSYKVVTGPQAAAMGLDPNGRYQVSSSGAVSMIGNAPAQQYGGTITGNDAKQLGLDPNGVYQRGPDGKVSVVQAPQQQAGPIVSGDQAGQMGLDPAKTWQQNANGQWSAIDKPEDPGTQWRTVTDQNGKPLYQESNKGERKAIPGQEGGGAFKQENTLRDEYNTLTKDFRTVQDAFNKINGTSNTGAGDMSLLYSYVKLLDPGSVVRESEFATAAASGSFGQQIQGAVSRIMSGERLPDSLRASFKAEAKRIYEGQKAGYDNAGKQYSDLARKAGIDPSSVVIPYDTAPPVIPQSDGTLPGLDVWQEYGLVPPPNYKPGGVP